MKKATEGVAQDMGLQDSSLFFVPQRRFAPKLRLFYFPFAGGSAQSYQYWLDSFNPDIELVFVQLKGRGSRICELPHQSMQDLVEELVGHSAYLTEYPYIVFGHSMGALISYALCCQLKQLCLPLPLHLFASACRAPHLPYEHQSLYALPQDEFIQALEQLKGTPTEVLHNKELMELFEPMLRADFKIAETYKAELIEMPFSFSVFYGDRDHSVQRHQLQAWSELTDKSCVMTSFPGEHFFIRDNAHPLADSMQSVITQLMIRMDKGGCA